MSNRTGLANGKSVHKFPTDIADERYRKARRPTRKVQTVAGPSKDSAPFSQSSKHSDESDTSMDRPKGGQSLSKAATAYKTRRTPTSWERGPSLTVEVEHPIVPLPRLSPYLRLGYSQVEIGRAHV